MSIDPEGHVSELRISYAKEYLIRTDYSIQEIAKMVGFHSDIYFSNCFKKIEY